MGIFGFLFASKKKTQAQSAQQLQPKASKSPVSHFGNFIEFSSIGFFGQFKKSKSSEWVIAWSDTDDEQLTGGYRHKGHGRYVLYNELQNRVVLQGKLERPNNGNAANNGFFSIEDWHFGDALSGTLYVFSPTGKEIIRKKLEANIFNSGISDSGRYAICQTANNPKSDHGNLLVSFDATTGAELFSVNPCEWASSYEFIEDIPYFVVVISDLGKFRYDLHGNFIDAQKYNTARLNCNRFEIVLLAAEEILKSSQLDKLQAKTALEAAVRARSLGADKDIRYKPIALKIEGLAHEVLGNTKEALSAFEEALKINPKIGVKRKVDSLRKKLVEK